MIEPNWIMEDKLVVSTTPVIANSVLTINDQ